MMAAVAAVATTSVAAAVFVRQRSKSNQDLVPETPQPKKVGWAPHDPLLPATPKARGDPGTDSKNGKEPKTVREAIDESGRTKHVPMTKAKKRLAQDFEKADDHGVRRSKRCRTAKKNYD